MVGLFTALNRRLTTPPRETSRERYWVPTRDQTSGIWMDADEAIRISAVWACVTVIAKAIASSDWAVFREDEAGNREPQKGTTVWKLLNLRPNDEMTPYAYRVAILIQALVYGNSFSEIERDMMGRAVALWPLYPDRCCLERDTATGKLVLRVNNQDGGIATLPYADVFHVHGPSLDGVAGFDLVKLAARSLAQNAAAERFSSSFYANGAAVGGILKSAANIGAEKRKELREEVSARHKGPDKAFNFMVLDGGLDFQKLTVDPEQAQFVETRYFLIEETCRWFGVPPHKIAHLLRATNNNIEHQGLEFVRDALTPWCESLRQEADWKLVAGSGRFLRTRIDTDWLSAGDAKSRAETDSILVMAGIKLRNEARRDRGLNSLGADGDVPTVNPGTTALPIALAAPAKSAPPPAEDDPPANAPPTARKLNGHAPHA